MWHCTRFAISFIFFASKSDLLCCFFLVFVFVSLYFLVFVWDVHCMREWETIKLFAVIRLRYSEEGIFFSRFSVWRREKVRKTTRFELIISSDSIFRMTVKQCVTANWLNSLSDISPTKGIFMHTHEHTCFSFTSIHSKLFHFRWKLYVCVSVYGKYGFVCSNKYINFTGWRAYDVRYFYIFYFSFLHAIRCTHANLRTTHTHTPKFHSIK